MCMGCFTLSNLLNVTISNSIYVGMLHYELANHKCIHTFEFQRTGTYKYCTYKYMYILNVSEPKVHLRVGNCTALNALGLLIKVVRTHAIDGEIKEVAQVSMRTCASSHKRTIANVCNCTHTQMHANIIKRT